MADVEKAPAGAAPQGNAPHRAERRAMRELARLRQRADRLFTLHELSLPIPGAPAPYRITLPADPDGPLDQLVAWQTHQAQPPAVHGAGAADDARRAVYRGAHLPYWSLLWPSGMALAEALLATQQPTRERRALELGCGLGVTAIAALQAGASLLAADCFADALLFCCLNTQRNVGRPPATLLLDWRTPAGREACLVRAPFDLVLAADVLYEREDEAPLLDLVPRLLTPDGVFWLAEPGRRASLAFVAAALARGWRDEPTTYERIWPHDDKPTRITVHRFRLSPP